MAEAAAAAAPGSGAVGGTEEPEASLEAALAISSALLAAKDDEHVVLPTGKLCFAPSSFTQDSFDAATFVAGCRRRVTLETLKEDLNEHQASLRSQLVELINRDYADFVNLSANLSGLDTSVATLSQALRQVRERIAAVHDEVTRRRADVAARTAHRDKLRRQHAVLSQCVSLRHALAKLHSLLRLDEPTDELFLQDGSTDADETMERVSLEFNRMTFLASRAAAVPYVAAQRERIERIRSVLLRALSTSVLQALQNRNTPLLASAMRCFATIGALEPLLQLLRTKHVRPAAVALLKTGRMARDGVGVVFDTLLEFVRTRCDVLQDAAPPGVLVIADVVWAEVTDVLASNTPDLFSFRYTDTFHANYSAAFRLIDQLAALAKAPEDAQAVRTGAATRTFSKRWGVPVYYRLRFQEIVSTLAPVLVQDAGAVTRRVSDSARCSHPAAAKFALEASHIVWAAALRCWADDVVLPPIAPQLLRLTLQLFARHAAWLRSQVGETLVDAEPPTLAVIAADAAAVAAAATHHFVPMLQRSPHFPDGTDIGSVFADTSDVAYAAVATDIAGAIATQLVSACTQTLRSSVLVIPRTYRFMGKPMPTAASFFVAQILQPLTSFLGADAGGQLLGADVRAVVAASCVKQVAQTYCAACRDVLASIEKQEGQARASAMLRGAATAEDAAASDNDKMRAQLVLDAKQFAADAATLLLPAAVPDDVDSLLDTVTSAVERASGWSPESS